MQLWRWGSLFTGLAVIAGSTCPQAGLTSSGAANCNDGATAYNAVLIGATGQAGGMAYRASADGCREFIVRVAGFPPGGYAVTVQTTNVGQITVGTDGKGQLIYDTKEGNFPSNFPGLTIGDPADVGALAAGRFIGACPAAFEICTSSSQVDSNGSTVPCTEDASAYVMVVVAPDSVLTRSSPCPNIKPTLETRLASVHFVNTHPSRKVAIAVALTTASDRRSVPPGPCTYALQQGGTYSSLDECHLSIAEACNSPVDLFIGPAQSSAVWTYQCKYESIGSGSCADQQLETQTWSVLAHAVFCDDYNQAQDNFCSRVISPLLDDGQPAAGLTPIQSSDCP
ncbi:MAG TPA: hypothetical protein VMV81_13825 [Phycisphaerae bacterium]|nr:hypothetical protein [Phycisphaerae bacterium]